MKPRWPTTLASKSSAIARKACGLLLVLIALSSPAIAQQFRAGARRWWEDRPEPRGLQQEGEQGQNNNNQVQNNNQGRDVSAPEIDPGSAVAALALVSAPEIDPGSAVAALALMSCGTLILTDRRRGR